jgi:hypothetical protein
VNPRGAALLTALVLFSTASATTYAKLTLVQQVEKADLIVRATVKQKTTQTRAEKVWTVYTLEISKFYKGDKDTLKDSSFAVYDSEKVKLEGAPRLNQNDDLFLMLYAKTYDSPIVGFRQGAYKVVEGDKISTLDDKPVTIEVDSKPIQATLATFTKQLETLTGAAK